LYFPIGMNIAWATSLNNTLADYQRWFDKLSQNGGNFARVWMSSWDLGIEWEDTGLGDYTNRLKQAWLLDQVFQMADQRGIFIMLTLLNHGSFSRTVDPEWSGNPYNARLGGPLLKPQDFVTDPQAIDFFKRRLR
jgi:aryl-phospho-beta-D-glucosidase BglC (GH1 family)